MQTELAHLVSSFDCDPNCGNPEHFNNFLRYNAISDGVIGMGVTHVALGYDDEGTPVKIQGFVTIKTNSVVSVCDGINNGVPAMEIAELAVDKDIARQGLGTMLIKHALSIIDEIRCKVGIKYAVVCADELAIGFYEKVGFTHLSDYYVIPREQWNAGCVPMCIDLTIGNEPYYGDVDDESF